MAEFRQKLSCDVSNVVENKGKSKKSLAMDIRIKRVVKIRAHKKSEGLNVDKVLVGESEACTVVANLLEAYLIKELRGMKMEVACSLVTANVGVVESESMTLAEKSKARKVLSADEGARQFDNKEVW